MMEIRAHSSEWTIDLLKDFTKKTSLKTFDIEASNINDHMLRTIAKSTTITELDIGATSISGKGLADIVMMGQLESLDIWATRIVDKNLPLLRQLENLQYLALGGQPEQTRVTADGAIPHLLSMPSLKRLWLHNVFVDKDTLKMLKMHFEHVRYDYDT